MLAENKSIDFILELENTNESSHQYFIKLYEALAPIGITCGINFTFQKDMALRKKIFKKTNFIQIIHKYDQINSTSKIIEKIKGYEIKQ